MAKVVNKNELQPRHVNPEVVIFSVFTAEEIRKLCTTKICTPLTFDALGHPLPGGLYDRALGPLSERSEPCGTCFKNVFSCPGHYGFIELPLPVVNPVFYKVLWSILRISCLSCFHIQLPVHFKRCLSIQMKLLNRGMVIEANEIESTIQILISQYETLDKVPEEAVAPFRAFEALTEECDEKVILNKNTESLKNQFVNDMLKQIKPKKACMHCKAPLDKFQSLRNRIILAISKKKVNVNDEGSVKAHDFKYVTAEETRRYLRSIWEVERELLLQIVPVLNNIKVEYPTDVFYFEIIPVPPPNTRPVNFVQGRMVENTQTLIYKSVLQNSMLLRTVMVVMQKKGDANALPVEAQSVYKLSPGSTPAEKLHNAWEALQVDIDNLVDMKSNRNYPNGQGLKQILEKKAGIIRMHMMGKRVNFAARTVITPDPNLNVDEIGVPEEFAKRLTYPMPVTSWNVEEVRKMILNGPNIHPGAVAVEYEDGRLNRINASDPTQREALLKRLLTPDDRGKAFRGVKRVHRHLCNGDILLLNRQPTLHKPSIMAHSARILKGEKTFRLHYANCKAYNADFDGDEMNAHFPQNELARSEGYLLANVCNQYLVPKDGTPLSGLIQDHVISGVKLSTRGRFFNRSDYQQLVFQALGHNASEIKLLPPAICKPCVLWSGKQVLSSVIINIIPKGKQLINLTSTAKINAKAWEVEKPRLLPFGDSNNMSEAEVVIRNGELLVGVLDKTHYGATPYGLVHCIYEIYGGSYAIRLLSALSKLFTYFLQLEGFTLGVHDILVLKKADRKRSKIIKECRKIGIKAITEALAIPEDSPTSEIVDTIEKLSATNPKLRSIIDRQYKSALDSYTNDINKTCLPAGLLCKFPKNNLQLMVQSGAKGSTVNTMQISCLLGQIELEGKRPPVMISGKTLPSFPTFEFAPRAGGFIDGRFMTGIQPQEFFFHCMAGREGLIDTAVKTSRSGYLQRCLIKHLEGLTVGYDLTVRDSDKTVIQFLYGEDGMDVTKAQFLNEKQLKILSENSSAIVDKATVKALQRTEDLDKMEEHIRKLEEWKREHGNPLLKRRVGAFAAFSTSMKGKIAVKKAEKIDASGRDRWAKCVIDLWQEAQPEIKNDFKRQCMPCPNPTNTDFQPDCYYGALPDRLAKLLPPPIKSKKKRRDFEKMLKLKTMQSLTAPGEPVGLLAAQSVGEPSTQMTLNTFHFAGRGEMNVTLGIPRLREILMIATKNVKTPSMEIPFKKVRDLEKRAEDLRKILTRVVVADVLEKIDVSSQLELGIVQQLQYTLRFQFLPHRLYKSQYHVKPKYILKHMTKRFFGLMFSVIRKATKTTTAMVAIEQEKKNRATSNDEDGEEEAATVPEEMNIDSSDEEPEDQEDAKQGSKFKQTHDDQEPEDEERVLSDNEENTEALEHDEAENSVLESHTLAENYVYDKKKHLWCEITFSLPLKKIDLTAILRNAVRKSVLWEVPNINRAITYMKDDSLMLRTDGINIGQMFKYNELLDLNKLHCNDIHKVADTYGIEAAAKVIVKEVQDVFQVYGITVDPRHLILIADYMTSSGVFAPMNRTGMESSASPFQQMSFESTLTFLRAATVKGKHDQLQGPSSCLMVGKPCNTGTGSFSLLNKLG